MVESASDRRQRMKDELLKRTQESYDRKDDFGTSFTFFKKDLEDMNFWKVRKEGIHMFDIVPFVAGPNMPMDSKGSRLKEGSMAYVMDIQIHQGVGTMNAQYVCPARNYGEKCPICEHQAQLKKEVEYDEELVKGLYPRRRVVYNVIVWDSKEEEEKGVQVLEVSHFFMEKHLTPLAKDGRTGALIPFADPDSGKTIQFTATMKTVDIGGKPTKVLDFGGHKFLDRDYSLSDEDLDSAYPLDGLIHIPTYDEVYEAYWGELESSGEKEEKPVEKGTRTRARRSAPAETSTKEQEPEKPTAAAGRRSRDTAAKAEEKVEGDTCPSGGQFGVDIDNLEGCNECDVFDNCAGKADQLKAQSEKERPSPSRRQPRKASPSDDAGGSEDASAGTTLRRRRPGA